MEQITTAEMWTRVINDALFYDGTPQMMGALIKHFEDQGLRISKLIEPDGATPIKAFSKKLPEPTEQEIMDSAKCLWRDGNKLSAVKKMMTLWYDLKLASDYCRQHFD